MELQFFLPMKSPPTVTHQEKAVRVVHGKPIFYEPAPLRTARLQLTACLGQHSPKRRFTGPLRLVVKWCFPLDKGGRHQNGTYKTSKPDTDNLQKLLKDCMTATGYWEDDAQVASEICEKFWSEIPGIYIQLTELECNDSGQGGGANS